MKKHKHPAFKVPEGYLNDFQKRLMERINREETEVAISAFPKSDGFEVPKGYFEAVSKKVLSQKQPERKKRLFVSPYYTFYYSAAAIAALLLLIFGIPWKTERSLTFEALATADLEAYLEKHLSEISPYEIAETVSFSITEWNTIPETRIKEEALREYLNENIEDLNIEYNE